ncbi:MAG: 50S ribosomal protein L23 [Spirochaetia bacterium]|nr:50S ribosomal protein L23 [Spirochaetia bacterium]
MVLENVLIEPVVTEKTNILKEEKAVKYAFKVLPEANKFQIMEAVEKVFGVKPAACNVMWVRGKQKATRTRSGYRMGEKSSWKKAIITLAPGDKIDIFDGV